ncbi:ZAR1-like protein [Manacus vitellinus]|uniref:ZAR1-like protein n=1 Tax=Manacus vitellinus TaxID=328815 RepID=UPI00115EEE80|nr:ZAR1-like protein [Manacus vitellinus]
MIMEGFVCSPFSTYQGFRGSPAPGRGQDPSAKQPSWKQSKSGGISPFLGGQATFQFLEQKYGYFHCKDCKTRWESAYVWCISGSNKVYFKQLCRKCQKGFNPYRVEAIQCQICSRTRCSCPQKKRHIDLKRPHRQELCGRCKGKRLSCDNTYSFKYIV